MIQPASNLPLVLDEDIQYLPVEKPRFFTVAPAAMLPKPDKAQDDFRPRWWRVNQPDEQ
jgi:hypothetical protein